MDDFDDQYKSAVEAGQHNLRAIKLLKNWCVHAECIRSPGRGMVEEFTGLPIGHMCVQCKFAKKSSMYCWSMEDAAFDFYQSNCKGCEERIPVGIPNIMDFVGPREKAAENRRLEREEEERKVKQKQADRRQERANLRYELSLEETFVFDLLDELDNEGIARDDLRLEQLANLAPEAFTRKVVEHLLPSVLHEHLPYSESAAKALLRAPLEPEEKLSVAVRMLTSYGKSPRAIDVVLSNSEKLSQGDLVKILCRFVSMALGPPPGPHLNVKEPISLDAVPINSLFQRRRVDICEEVSTLISDPSPGKIRVATEVILATDSDELLSRHARSIIGKLMRRRTLLPEERKDSSLIYYLRQASSKCLERFPKKTDEIIQSFLLDNDDIGKKEANLIYRSVLENCADKSVLIGDEQRIAFRRLLWTAIESPDNNTDDAVEFFRHSWDEFPQLAVENFDDLIGAAATLSDKYEKVKAECSLELANNFFDNLDRNNKCSAIESLQGSLVEWAAVGARSKGNEGVEQFLELYRKLPENQIKMRGSMIAHVSSLLTGVESLNLVLSDWYRALMDDSTVVRASAVQAWKGVPYDLVKNFPDLFFEAFSVLLMDPYVIVHRSAVQSLMRRPFPEEQCSRIKSSLWRLVVYYSKEGNQEDFVVDCIDAFAFLCLSPEERKGKLGEVLSNILLSLEGRALYRAVDRLHYRFKDVPGFVKVVMKSIQDGYTRSISIDDCASAILTASHGELKSCVDDIKNAFEALRPFRPEDFSEALLYAVALTKVGDYKTVSGFFKEIVDSISEEERNELWRVQTNLILKASEIECAISDGESFSGPVKKWRELLSDLEKKNEE